MKKSKEYHFDTEPPEAIIDEAGDESFPASDPLAWNLGLKTPPHSQNEDDLSHLLINDHELIKKVMHAILPLTKRLLTQQAINQYDKKIIKQLSQFFQSFVEQTYYNKSTLIYDEFHQSNFTHTAISEYLLKDLLNEHEYGKELFTDLQKMLQNLSTTNNNIIENYIRILNNIHHLYLTHIEKEEEYILPRIQQLNNSVQKKLVNKFNDINNKTNLKELNVILEILELDEST